MTAWLEAAPALLLAVALATLPGLPTAWALRFRGLGLLAVSVGASFAIIAVASLLAPFAGVRWSALPVLGTAVLVALAAVVARRFLPAAGPVAAAPSETSGAAAPRHRAVRPLGPVAIGGSLVIAAAVVGVVLMRAIGDPSHPSQTSDGVFHLNAVAQILQTGDASPLHMNLAYPERPNVFYPTLWHALVALVAQLSGAGIAVSANAASIAISAWVWPVAVLFFAAPFFVRRPVHLVLAAILAAAFPGFPYLFLDEGVLYSNLLSTALLPIALGAAHLALRHRLNAARGADVPVGGTAPLASLWIAVGGALGAAVLAQPNAFFGFSALLLPLLVAVAVDVGRSAPTRAAKVWRWGGLAVAVAVIAVLWVSLATEYDSPYDIAPLPAVLRVIGFKRDAWVLAVLVLVGALLLLLLIRRHRWLIGSYALVVALSVSAQLLTGPLRDLLTGGWYNGAWRIAALLPIIAVPLVGSGVGLLIDAVLTVARRAGSGGAATGDDAAQRASVPNRLLAGAAVAVILLLTAVGAFSRGVPEQAAAIAKAYEITETSRLLTPDRFALLQRLEANTPADALVAGDPLTGTAFAYALAGRNVLFPVFQSEISAPAAELATRLRKLDREQACALLTELHVTHVLDFPGRSWKSRSNPESNLRFIGLRKVGKSPALEEVDHEGRAVLYRVTC